MTKKIAVAIIHGIGSQTDDFANEMEEALKQQFAKSLKKMNISIADPTSQLVIKPICWSEIFEDPERKLWAKFRTRDLDYIGLRENMIRVFADAVAYQKSPSQKNFYKKIHDKIDEKLNELTLETGSGESPLCVIAHSLGTVITSDHFYDLQQGKRKADQLENPLVNGDTLTLFYTMGSPIALWSISYDEFDRPIEVPARRMKERYPNIGKWVNFYDKDDIIGYPLEPLYGSEFVKDHQVNVGGLLSSWNPLSHNHYWKDQEVIQSIVDGFVSTWLDVNHNKI
jgi:hypothetical protein